MADLSKRQYLKYAGASLAALSLGIGGKLTADGSLVPALRESAGVASATGANAGASPILRQAGVGDILDYERKDDGSVEFDWGYLSFESDEYGSFEIEDVGVDIEFEQDDDEPGGDFDFLEFTIEDSELYVDLDIREEDGDTVDLTIAFRDEVIDFESNYDDESGDIAVEFETTGQGHQLEDDGEGKDIEYVGRHMNFEFEVDDDEETFELEIRGPIKLDLDWNDDGDFDLDYADGRIAVDVDLGSLDVEYAGEDVMFEWEFTDLGTDDEFEARRI